VRPSITAKSKAATSDAATTPDVSGAGEAQSGRGPLLWLALVTFAIYLGYGLVSPVLPLYAESFGVGSLAVGVLVASYSVTSFAFDLYGGRLSDRYGARRMACGGALLVAAASVVAGAAPNFAVLLAGRALTGVGSALYVTSAMNILARTTPRERMARSMSFYQGAIMAGIAFGPSFGGLMASAFDYRVPLYGYAVLALLCAVVSIRTLPARLPQPLIRAGEAAGSVAGLLRDGAFITALALATTVFIIRAGVLSTLTPLFAHDQMHLSTQTVGYALTVTALVNLAVLPHAGGLSDRRHRKFAVLIGLAAGIVGMLLLAGSASPPALFAAMIGLGICTGYAGVSPAAIIVDVAPPGQSGMAMGLYRMGVDFGSITGPIVAGQLAATTSYRATFLVLTVPVALMWLLATRLRDTRRR
jgi:DHA1 family multidrug resistance protein-like MFS transporter